MAYPLKTGLEHQGSPVSQADPALDGRIPFFSSCQFRIITRLFSLAADSNAVLMSCFKGVSRMALMQSPSMKTSRQFGSDHHSNAFRDISPVNFRQDGRVCSSGNRELPRMSIRALSSSRRNHSQGQGFAEGIESFSSNAPSLAFRSPSSDLRSRKRRRS